MRHKCEHCGEEVENAHICPYCNNVHSKAWIKTATITDKSFNWFAAPCFIIGVIKLWNLPLAQFMTGMGYVFLMSIGLGIAGMILLTITYREES